jgi:putative redox protein
VCTWAAPASVYKIFRDKSQPDPADSASIILSGSDGSIRLNRDFLDDLATHAVLDQIKKISPRPILILHGTKDETVAPKEAQLLFDAALPPKNIVHIDNGDHSFRNNNREVWQQTADWLKQFVLRL